MSLTKKWYTIVEAASKFGVSSKQLQEWVDSGLVRAVENNDRMILINGTDIEREMNLVPSE